MDANFVNKQGKSKLSDKCMASLMYAIVMCKAKLIGTHGIGIYGYTRKQNNRHSYDFMISIDEGLVSRFEEMADIKLSEPIEYHLN